MKVITSILCLFILISSGFCIELLIDDSSSNVSFQGKWMMKTEKVNNENNSYHYIDGNKNTGMIVNEKFIWNPEFKIPGMYEVQINWQGSISNSSRVKYIINHDNGVTEKIISQRTFDYSSKNLGIYHFNKGKSGSVELFAGNGSRVVADSVRFILQKQKTRSLGITGKTSLTSLIGMETANNNQQVSISLDSNVTGIKKYLFKANGSVTSYPYLSCNGKAQLSVSIVDANGNVINWLSWKRNDHVGNSYLEVNGNADQSSMFEKDPGDWSPSTGLTYTTKVKKGSRIIATLQGNFGNRKPSLKLIINDGGNSSGTANIANNTGNAACQLLQICKGKDPDIAVDSLGALHIVYEDGSTLKYRKIVYPNNIGNEVIVGKGKNPQITVDSKNNPHIVMNSIDYTRWNGNGFDAPKRIMSGWRKPRIAINKKDVIFLTVERKQRPRIMISTLSNGKIIKKDVIVGEDNNGAVDCDILGNAHITWRKGSNVFHNSFSLNAGVGNSKSLGGKSSDFSWVAVDPSNDSVHVVNTIAHGKGINYRNQNTGSWSSLQTLGVNEVTGVDDPDNVGPTISIDSTSFKYIVFAGKGRIPYYIILDANGNQIRLDKLDPTGISNSGGKYKNPNVSCDKNQKGAYAIWGSGTVCIRKLNP